MRDMTGYSEPDVRLLELGVTDIVTLSGFTSSIVPGSEGEPGSIEDIIDAGNF